MLAELKMSLEADSEEFGCYQSSNLQGVLMERLDPDYAALLHQQGLNPYSQFLYHEKGQGLTWVVRTVTREAYEEIVLPLLSQDFSSFEVRKKNIHVKIMEKSLKTLKTQSLMDDFYAGEGSPYMSVEFLTPAAFKQNGRYVNYPDIRLLFKSLMNKYSASSGELEMFDSETLEQLTGETTVSRYQLRSVSFPLEGVRIPAFLGRMTLRIHGSRTMANYARLLVRFGEYSGIGIKTGMGMGAIKLIEKEKV